MTVVTPWRFHYRHHQAKCSKKAPSCTTVDEPFSFRTLYELSFIVTLRTKSFSFTTVKALGIAEKSLCVFLLRLCYFMKSLICWPFCTNTFRTSEECSTVLFSHVCLYCVVFNGGQQELWKKREKWHASDWQDSNPSHHSYMAHMLDCRVAMRLSIDLFLTDPSFGSIVGVCPCSFLFDIYCGSVHSVYTHSYVPGPVEQTLYCYG